MRIAVFGLGYVGSVTAACLAKMGHRVIGVDVAPAKVDLVKAGHSPVAEPGLEKLIRQAVRDRRLETTLEASEAVAASELSLIAVGTPSRSDGGVDLNAVKAVAKQIGIGLRGRKTFHTVALRSTVPPGTTAGVLSPILERVSGKKAGRDFGVCYHPEFLREGTSVHDFFHPPRTVIGASQPKAGKVLTRLWRPIRAPLLITSLESAELLKYADNAFHALKICYANEIASLAKSCGADGRQVMEIFVQDTKLNISPLYFKPGFAFGGPCLPKDVRALCALGKRYRVAVPLAQAILESNESHLRRAVRRVLATGKKRIGVVGLAFKAGTDDLRESPMVSLVRELLLAKRIVRIYDPKVELERLWGANRKYIERELPQIARLLARSWEELLETSEVIVLARGGEDIPTLIHPLLKQKTVVDLTQS